MKINRENLKQEQQWQAITGRKKASLIAYYPLLLKSILTAIKRAYSQRKVEVNINYCIQNEEELLLFLTSLSVNLVALRVFL